MFSVLSDTNSAVLIVDIYLVCVVFKILQILLCSSFTIIIDTSDNILDDIAVFILTVVIATVIAVTVDVLAHVVVLWAFSIIE